MSHLGGWIDDHKKEIGLGLGGLGLGAIAAMTGGTGLLAGLGGGAATGAGVAGDAMMPGALMGSQLAGDAFMPGITAGANLGADTSPALSSQLSALGRMGGNGLNTFSKINAGLNQATGLLAPPRSPMGGGMPQHQMPTGGAMPMPQMAAPPPSAGAGLSGLPPGALANLPPQLLAQLRAAGYPV